VKEKIGSWLSSLVVNPAFTLFCFFLLSIPVQLGRHFWPIFSSINGLRIDYLSPTLYFSDLIIGFLFIDMLPLIFRVVHYRKLLLISCILLVFSYLSVNSLSPINSLLGVARLAEVIFLVFACARFFSNSDLIGSFRMIISSSILVVSILAIWQFLNQSSIGGLWYFLGERSFTILTPGIADASLGGTLLLRPYASFPHPNVLAGFIVITSIYLLYFTYSKKEDLWCKYLTKLALGSGAVVAILTMSRTGITVLAMVYGVWIIRNFVNKYYLIGGCFGLIGIGAILFQTGIYQRFTTLSFSDQAVVLREFLAIKAWYLFSQHPLSGVGLQNFLPSLAIILPSSTQLIYFQPVHSVYLLVLSETGILGGFLILSLLVLVMYRIIKSEKRVGKIVLLISLLLLSSTDHYFYTLHQGQLLLAFSLGLLLADGTSLFTRLEAKNLRKENQNKKIAKRISSQPVKISRIGRSSVKRK